MLILSVSPISSSHKLSARLYWSVSWATGVITHVTDECKAPVTEKRGRERESGQLMRERSPQVHLIHINCIPLPSRSPTSRLAVKMGTNKSIKQKEWVGNSPPPLWGACISCTPSATSSPSARLSYVLTACQKKKTKKKKTAEWTFPPPTRRDVCNTWRRVSTCGRVG